MPGVDARWGKTAERWHSRHPAYVRAGTYDPGVSGEHVVFTVAVELKKTVTGRVEHENRPMIISHIAQRAGLYCS